MYIKDQSEESGRQVGAKVMEITASLDYLVNGLFRVVDFYNSKSGGQPIEKMLLTGVGGSFQGMSEMLQERMGIPVAAVKKVEGLSVPRDFNARGLGDFIACIGATMHPLNLLLTPEKDKKQKENVAAGGKDNTGVAAIVCAGGVLVACALAAASLIPYKKAQDENKRLLNRIEELKPVEVVHDTYVEAQTLWMDADNMYELTENHNEYLVAFIQELEQKMPSDIVVLSMVASADNVTLNIDVESKASAAKILQELRAFDTIEVVQTAGLTDVRDDYDDTHVVSFSVNCIYTDLQEQQAQQEQAEQEQEQESQSSEDEDLLIAE